LGKHTHKQKWRFQTEANKFDRPKQEEEEEEEVWIALPSSPGRVHVVLEDDELLQAMLLQLLLLLLLLIMMMMVPAN
jgi:hypothetical protein